MAEQGNGNLVVDAGPRDSARSVWQTPHACTFTSASPGPGSGTRIVSTVTGAPFARATTPRTSCVIDSPVISDNPS